MYDTTFLKAHRQINQPFRETQSRRSVTVELDPNEDKNFCGRSLGELSQLESWLSL